MAGRLKVFAARLGFFETVVAAPSQKAALAAWGVQQDLFKEGHAVVSDDPVAQVALEQPGVVLRRTAGSQAPFAANAAVDPALVPDAPARRGRKKPAPPPQPKPPDRSSLIAAEKAAANAESEFHRNLADLADRRRALHEEEASLRRYHERRRRELDTAVARARAAYRAAGGEA